MAPIIDAMKPAGRPGSYQPMARPRNPATNAPAMPSRIVIKQPPGSRPGISSFAIAPTTKPIISVPRIVAINSICLCKLDSTARGVQPVSRLQLDYLRAADVITVANFLEQFFAGGGIEIQDGERGAAGLISAK